MPFLNNELSLEDLVDELDKETKKFSFRLKLKTVSNNFVGYYFRDDNFELHSVTKARSRATVFDIPEGLSQLERNVYVKKIKTFAENALKSRSKGTIYRVPIRLITIKEEFL